MLLWNVFCNISRNIVDILQLPGYLFEIIYAVGDSTARVVLAAIIIWLGVKLIQGKKEELKEGVNEEGNETEHVDSL